VEGVVTGEVATVLETGTSELVVEGNIESVFGVR
jgi:hypothetical protein